MILSQSQPDRWEPRPEKDTAHLARVADAVDALLHRRLAGKAVLDL
ncbi:MAG TPA: hypothetical protein VH561_18185 [Micromonosporaceae bacterium]